MKFTVLEIKNNQQMKKIFLLFILISALSCQGQNKEVKVSRNKVEESSNNKTSSTTDALSKKNKIEFQVISPEIRQKEYDLFKSHFKKEIKLPIIFVEDVKVSIKDTISNALYNRMLFKNQVIIEGKMEYAKFYASDDSLIEWSDSGYGLINEKETNETSPITKKNEEPLIFRDSIYALGMLKLSEEYDSYLIKGVLRDMVFIDLYVFDKQGGIKGFLKIYEEEIGRVPETRESFYNHFIYEKFFETKILKDGFIKRVEKRFGLTIFTEWKLEKDGYFKVFNVKKEGEYWYAD